MNDVLQLTLNGVATGCIYGLVALGFVLVYKASEVVNFAQGDLMMLGAFVAVILITKYGFNYGTAFVVAIFVLAFVGVLLDLIVVRRIIGQPHFAVIMLTLGLGLMIRSAAAMAWGPETRTMPTPFAWTAKLDGVFVSMTYISIIVGTFVLCGLLYIAFRFTRVGVAIQACSQNQLAAAYVGIPVKLMLSIVWGVSAATAAVAGILVAPVSLVDVNMGSIGLHAFAAAVLGGFGSILGALVGGILIGIMEVFGAVYFQDAFRNIAPYALLLMVLVLRPQGLFGAVARKKV
jgi:branched-chain amino acid transport system permease protein